MRIYTGRGDGGRTDLRDMSRVSKASPRIEAYGTVDEVNALVGVVQPTGYDDLDEQLRAIQNHLHIVQADFATPDPDEEDPAVREETSRRSRGGSTPTRRNSTHWSRSSSPEEARPGPNSTTPGPSAAGPSVAPSRSRPMLRSTTSRSHTSTASWTRCSCSRAS
jgi:hypothetical protein